MSCLNSLMSSLIAQLEKFIEDEPNDPFNYYALALEYMKSDVGMARDLFEKLLLDHENYVPTYYHLGHLYADLGKFEEAVATFEKGISIARTMNDSKAVRELSAALDALD